MFVRIVVATPDTVRPEQGGLGPIHADGQLRPAFFAADLRIGDAGRVLEQFDDVRRRCGGTRRGLRRGFRPRAGCPAAAAQRARQLLVAARGARRDRRAGNADEHSPQVGRDLIVRARALVARRQLDRDVDARRRAAHAAGAGRTDQVGRFRHVAADQFLEALRDLLAALDARAAGEPRRHGDFALVGLRHELGGNRGQDDERDGGQRRRQADHRQALAERAVEQRAIARCRCPSSARSLDREEPARRGRARSSTGTGIFSRREQSTGTTVTATNSDIESENITTIESWTNRMLDTPREEEQRHEHGHVRERGRENRRPDFLAALDRRLHARLAMLHVPVRVLEHDDRGVDDHADAQRQAAERHRVQRESGEVEQRERADDRNRNRRADDERGPEVSQEDEDDER